MDWEGIAPENCKVFGRKRKRWFLRKRGLIGWDFELSLAQDSQGRSFVKSVKATIGFTIILHAMFASTTLLLWNLSIFTLYLHLDRPSLWIGSCLECLHCILELEPMGHQLLHIDDSALHKSDSSWPGIAVSILKL